MKEWKGRSPGVCLLWSPESLVFSSYVEAHAFTLSAHTSGQYWNSIGWELGFTVTVASMKSDWELGYALSSDGTFLPMCACDSKGNLSCLISLAGGAISELLWRRWNCVLLTLSSGSLWTVWPVIWDWLELKTKAFPPAQEVGGVEFMFEWRNELWKKSTGPAFPSKHKSK